MEMNKFVRRPFVVSAVQITENNIEEINKIIGSGIKVKDGERYIVIDKRVIEHGLSKAFVGYWVTCLDDNYRCWTPTIFEKEFEAYKDQMSYDFAQEEYESSLS